MRKLIVLIALVITTAQAFAQAVYKVVKTFPIASSGWWDYLAVNANKLYVSHGTQVNILDKTTGDSLGIITGTNGVHGIAFDNASGNGYTSNGSINNVFVFNLATGTVIDSIATGQNPDAIMYEPYSSKIITCNGRSNNLTVIDPATNKVATIEVAGKPETAVSNYMGKLFVNIEDKNQIAVVDLSTMKMTATWSLGNGREPTGLAYDSQTKRLFAGCDKLLVVLDANSGKLVQSIPIGEGCDGVAFDSTNKTIFTANGEDGNMSVIKEQSPASYKLLETVTTKQGARTITIDPVTHNLYFPTAQFEADTPQGQRPKMIAGTFQVLVVAKPNGK